MNNEKEWRDVPNYEGLYKINNFGEIFSIKSNKILKPEILKKEGYLRIGLVKNKERKRFMVHRLVMYAFVEERPYPDWEVNHKDFNVKNNKIDNLEWVTLQENMHHACEHTNKREIASQNMSVIGKKYYHVGVESSKKPVARIDVNTLEVLEKYESAREASKQGYNYKDISQVCRGERKTHRGFKWSFIDNLKKENT